MKLFVPLLVLLSSFFCSHLSLASDRVDSLDQRQLFPKHYGTKTARFLIGLDANRSFFSGSPIKFNGIRTGIEYRGVHRVGVGIYAMPRPQTFSGITVDHPGATDTSIVAFNINYFSSFYERVFYKSAKWELSIPSYLSGGLVNGSFGDTTGTLIGFLESQFSSLSSGFQTKYYLLPWLAPRVSIGYRLLFNTNNQVKKAFTRTYYSFGVSVLAGELYRTILAKRKSEEERST